MSEVYLRFPGGKAKAVTLSYDDGVEQDQKLMRIIDRYGIKCTFNINSGRLYDQPQKFEPGRIHRIMTQQAAKELFKNSHHEVAVHTFTHPHIDDLSPYQLSYEILADRKKLESIFDTEVRGMAYPYGAFNDQIVQICRDCGIAYSRTTQPTYSFNLPHDWLRLNPTCHHASGQLPELMKTFLERKTPDRPMLFYLWGHSYEFEQNNNWEVIENFAKVMGGHDDIWYATNIEIYEYVESFRALRFFADGTKVYNPTSKTLEFAVYKRDRLYAIHPGETIDLSE